MFICRINCSSPQDLAVVPVPQDSSSSDEDDDSTDDSDYDTLTREHEKDEKRTLTPKPFPLRLSQTAEPSTKSNSITEILWINIWAMHCHLFVCIYWEYAVHVLNAQLLTAIIITMAVVRVR